MEEQSHNESDVKQIADLKDKVSALQAEKDQYQQEANQKQAEVNSVAQPNVTIPKSWLYFGGAIIVFLAGLY